MKQLALKLQSIQQQSTVFVFLSGAALTSLALAADLIGVNQKSASAGFGPLQQKIALLGIAILISGFVLDLTVGQRRVFEWFKSIVINRDGLLKFSGVTLQLGLLTIVIQMFHLVNYGLYHNILLLTFFGFIIHYFLPHRLRLPFFLVLSLAGIFGVLGVVNALWLLGIGLALIGICHLPFSFRIRVIILLVAAAIITALRTGIIGAPWSDAIWPILASMFMFRLIIYMYDLNHKKTPVSFSRSLSYFFMLPNVCFVLFPIVDYTAYHRCYYDDDEYRIYQKGLKWMFWGVVHLILYRYINYYLVIPAEEVTSMSKLVQYMVVNYALILRLSGWFHLIVGMLHLFGFNLPRVMNLFFLSPSFSDYLRRVNVYWKDFIQKVFYYPTYFRLRRFSPMNKLVLATLFGFLMTWFLHAYQWFWIRGSFLLATPDIIFWSCLIILMLSNSIYESKYQAKRSLQESSRSIRALISRTLRIVGVFLVIAFLWSLWISPSVEEWLAMLSAANVTLPGVIAALLVATVVFLSINIWLEMLSKWKSKMGAEKVANIPFYRAAVLPALSILLLFLLGKGDEYSLFGEQSKELVANLKIPKLNSRDADLLTRGYYEDLSSVNRFNSQLWEIYMKQPADWVSIRRTDGGRLTGDFLRDELAPSMSIIYRGSRFTVNRWGMRDRDYEKKKPANTYRMALVGGSFVMGNGVGDDETFENLIEQRLNSENDGGAYANYEILNFAVDAYCPFQELMIMEKICSFEPDALLYSASPREVSSSIRHLIGRIQEGVEIPFPFIKDIVQQAGVSENTPENDAYRRLEPYGEEMLAWTYKQIISSCKENNILPIYIYFAIPQQVENDPVIADRYMSLAHESGFVVLDLTHLWDGIDFNTLRVAAWDWHPNSRGHQIMAEEIYEAFQKNADKIPLDIPAMVQNPEGKSFTEEARLTQ